MAGFGSFYKGEKKKKKKGTQSASFSSTPVFTHPQVLGKNKKEY